MRRMLAGGFGVVLGMVLMGAATGTRPATSRPARVREAGASTQASDGNKRAHAAWYAECEQRVAAAKGKPVDIVFIGDSITEGFVHEPTQAWPMGGKAVWEKHYAGRNVLDFGVGADRTEHVLWRLENMDVKWMRPKVAVVMIGTNNNIDTAESIAAGVKAVVAKTREVFVGTKVIVVSILPNARATKLMADANELIKKDVEALAKTMPQQVVYFDLASKFEKEGDTWKGLGRDKLHVMPEGYEVWATEMEPVLKEMMETRE